MGSDRCFPGAIFHIPHHRIARDLRIRGVSGKKNANGGPNRSQSSFQEASPTLNVLQHRTPPFSGLAARDTSSAAHQYGLSDKFARIRPYVTGVTRMRRMREGWGAVRRECAGRRRWRGVSFTAGGAARRIRAGRSSCGFGSLGPGAGTSRGYRHPRAAKGGA